MTDTVVTSGVTPWAQMIPEALALVPECPNPIIRDALHKAMREFFSTSRAWRGKQLTLLTTVAAQESYNANPPANAEVAQVMSCGIEAVESLVARGKKGLAAALGPQRGALGFGGEDE